MMRIRERVALVTGGSRGIGAATVRRLASTTDCTVYLTYQNQSEQLSLFMREVRERGWRVEACRCDSASEQDIQTLCQRIEEAHGQVDMLVNNAAVTDDALVMRMTLAQWKHVLDVNLSGPFLFAKYCSPGMIEHGWGRIVNVSSNSVRIPAAGQASYAASKGGLEALTRCLAAELGRKGITVNTVAPGTIDTEMTSDLKRKFSGAYPGHVWGKAEDVAEVIAFLLSDSAAYVQGQILTVDGGRLTRRPSAPTIS